VFLVYFVNIRNSFIEIVLDLKKLIKYDAQEASPRGEVRIQAGPTTINIQRLFEAHTVNSKAKQKEKPKELATSKEHHQKHTQKAQLQRQQSLQKDFDKQCQQQSKTHQRPLSSKQQTQPLTSKEQPSKSSHQQHRETKDKPEHQPLPSRHRFRTPSYKEITDAFDDIDLKTDQRPTSTRVKSADAGRLSRKDSVATEKGKQKKRQQNSDKENIPSDNIALQPPKSKMWIRPRSGSQVNRKVVKKTDPVALYQAYQKDWDKFKNNICESSHSDLRWTIREKMMGNQ
jgi:hypothetical protein